MAVLVLLTNILQLFWVRVLLLNRLPETSVKYKERIWWTASWASACWLTPRVPQSPSCGGCVVCSLSSELQTDHPFLSHRNEVRTECDHQVSQLPVSSGRATFSEQIASWNAFPGDSWRRAEHWSPRVFFWLHHLLLRAARSKWCFKIPGGKHLRSKCEEQDGRARLDQCFVLLPAPTGDLTCCLHFPLEKSIQNWWGYLSAYVLLIHANYLSMYL